MEEQITVEGVEPLSLFGVNNSKLKLIKRLFPKLKLIARGSRIKISGTKSDIAKFKQKFTLFIDVIGKYGNISESEIEELVSSDEKTIKKVMQDDVLVFTNEGGAIRAKTVNQRRLVLAVRENDLVFAVGPAGTGKTYTSVALAVNALKNKKVKRIILTRPAVEAGENLGFLPGDLKEKLDPYMQPLYDALRDMIPVEKLKEYLEKGTIEIAPLAFMRGRTLDKAFVIMDEAQNATEGQIRMFLTRMGKSAKFVVTGDVTQIDLPKRQPSGLLQAVNVLDKVKGIEIIKLDGKDIMRHKLVGKIIDAYDVIDGLREAGSHK
ncbi:MAG: phosphate starvation-inducible PhoH-like protein [Saprospiraceae bacterium]